MRVAARLAVALALFGAITAGRLIADDTSEAVGILYVVPIGLVAATCGFAGGVAAALLAVALLVLGSIMGPPLSALGYTTRIAGFLALGATVGLAEQRALEQARRARRGEEQLALLVEGISDHALVLLDPDGLITTWNHGAERLFGWTATEIVGRPSAVLYTREDVERGRPSELLRRAAVRRRVQDEGWRVRRDGRRFVAESVIAGLHHDGGQLRGYAQVVRDVSDRREIENALRRTTLELSERARELRRSNDELERFASVASHDLSEPLRTIAGFAELLSRRYGGRLDADANEFLAHIVAGTDRMQTLIDALLAYARAGRTDLVRAPVDTGALVDEVVGTLGTRVAETGARIERGDLPTVAADASALRQVFQNLIANALKFRGAEPPHVVVEAEPEGDGWAFSVTDNGIGLEAGQRERVFDMFARAHGAAYDGTGMGLAITAKIVERHGGAIRADAAPGGGSTFRLTLPSSRTDAGPPPDESGAEREQDASAAPGG